MSRIAPRISAIVVTRNDGYGSDQEKRFIFSMNAMVRLYDEVIVVDWNSPTQETLMDMCKCHIDRTGKILEIVVTEDDIKDLGYPSNIPLPEAYGRNIAIRRASSEYILSTNPDIVPIYPFGLQIPEGTLLTSPRSNTWNHRFFSLHDCGTFIDSCLREADKWDMSPKLSEDNPDRWSKISRPGDFQLGSRSLWNAMHGFEEGMIYKNHIDQNVQKKAHIYGNGVAVVDYRIVHLNHTDSTNLSIFNDESEWVYNFGETKNSPNWGAPTYQFKQRIW